MNSLVKTAKLGMLWRKNALPVMTVVRNHWNKDFAPGPYPQTQAERVAAAKRYGIPIEEYEPYPDDGMSYGDYPKLPVESGDDRDPYYPWDFPELKRNFKETMHVDFDMMTEDRVDINKKLHAPMWVLWAQIIGVLAGFYAIYAFSLKCKMFLPVSPPQYPKDGKVHYTFEPCD